MVNFDVVNFDVVNFDAVSPVVADRWVVERSDSTADPTADCPTEAVDRWAVVSPAANPVGWAHCADVLGDNADRSSSLRSTHGPADD